MMEGGPACNRVEPVSLRFGTNSYLDAVEATGGDTSPAAIRDAIIGHSFETPASPNTYTAAGYPIRDSFITQVQRIDGKLKWAVLKTIPAIPNSGYYTREAAKVYMRP